MSKKVLLALVLVSTLGSAFVFADTPVINQQQKNQTRRINQGVNRGKLSPQQAASLKEQLAAIRKMKQDMIKQNGGKPLTKEQLQQLKQQLNQSSKQIYQEKHPGGTSKPGPTQQSAGTSK